MNVARPVRRSIVAVIGNGVASDAAAALAERVGCSVVDAGFRLVTGGLGGVMEAASRGAHQSAAYREGDVLGILPGADAATANAWVDVAIASGLGIARNALVVATADAVIAVGGGSGTLSEISMAWQLGKVVVALDVAGWSRELAGRAVDDRRDGVVIAASTAAEAVAAVVRELSRSS
jgi:uncharacterized protein (TIGR00725 family)